jgi:hypothetical protein
MGYRPSYTPRRTATGKLPITTYISDQLFAELDIRARQANLSRAEYAALVLSHHIGMPGKSSIAPGMVTTSSAPCTVPCAEQAQAEALAKQVQADNQIAIDHIKQRIASDKAKQVSTEHSPKPQ